MRLHPPVPFTRLGVATAAEYLEAGWSRAAQRHAVLTGRLVRVAAGRFAPPVTRLSSYQQADLALARRAIAATIPRDRVAVSHLAAGYLHGCPIWADSPRSCVSSWAPAIRHMTGLHVHQVASTLPLVRKLDVPVTSMARTVVDIACEFGAQSALVTGDFALRHGLLELGPLEAAVHDCRGHTGIDNARVVRDLLDPLAESPLESRSRWHIREHGLPIPYSQVVIRTLDGRFLARVDHYWAEGVVGETDGTTKYVDRPDAYPAEKDRHQTVEDVDLEVARWGSRDFVDFSDAVARIERARRRRRARLVAGEVPRWVATTQAGAVIPVPLVIRA
ncbi:hypothetical protein ACXR2U_11195 [Jatrophihabitans sp. YIM 134969]